MGSTSGSTLGQLAIFRRRQITDSLAGRFRRGFSLQKKVNRDKVAAAFQTKTVTGEPMRRSAFYSSLRQPPTLAGGQVLPAAPPAPPARPSRLAAWRKLSPHDPRLLWSAIGLLALLLCLTLALVLRPAPPRLTQQMIDGAVRKTLETAELPSPTAKAYEAILPSVVQVVGYVKSKDGKQDVQHGVGTGVVIVDRKSVV